MFFVLSKALAFVLTSSNLLVLMGLLGLVLVLLRWPKPGWPFLIVGILGVALPGWSPLGPVLLMTLENRFPKQEKPSTITGIVVLGGAVDIHIAQARGSEAWNDQVERITAVAELANRFPAARIILSCGLTIIHAAERTCAECRSRLPKVLPMSISLPMSGRDSLPTAWQD